MMRYGNLFYDAVKSVSVNCEIHINFIFQSEHLSFVELAGCEKIHIRECAVFVVSNHRMSRYMRDKTNKEEDPLCFLVVCAIVEDGGHFPILVLPRTRRKTLMTLINLCELLTCHRADIRSDLHISSVNDFFKNL